MYNENLTFENLPSAISQMINKLEAIEASIASIQQQQCPSVIDTEPYIYGIDGLAKFLHVSTVTAQSIKNSGKIPYSQIQRTIIFDKHKVLEALSINKSKGGKKL
jgi:hypothetical protein